MVGPGYANASQEPPIVSHTIRHRSSRASAPWLLGGALVLAIGSAARTAQAEIASGYQVVGPIDVQTRYQRPTVAVYVELAAGESFQVQVIHEDDEVTTYEPYHQRRPLAVVRVTDPADHLIYHRVVDTAVVADDYPELQADDLAAGLLTDVELQADEAGTYVVRLSAGYEHTKLLLGLPEGSDYGLSYGNGIWRDWRDSSGPLWIWVPGHATEATTVELRHEQGSVTVWGPDDSWSHTLAVDEDWTHDVASGSGGELWRLDGLSTDWMVRSGGDVPIITATSPTAAEGLEASLLTIASGPLAGQQVPHRFQQRIAEELVPALVELVGDGAELRALVDDVLTADGCTTPGNEESARQGWELLRRDVPAVTWALDSWRFGAEATDHPFADVEHSYAIVPVMARLYAYVHPCNPWGPSAEGASDGRPELIARAALAALTHLMAITEDDRLSTGHDAFSNYAGGTAAFQTGDRAWPFAMVAPQLTTALPAPLGDDVLAAYTEGLRRLTIDRRFTDPFVSARNQSSCYLPAFGALALGRTAPHHETIIRAYADRFAASADPAGWFPESLGPDATYNGITHAQLAHYYVMTAWMPGCSDQRVRQALQKSYSFFNATVAPEPEGNMLGGFNFSHRTNWGFYAEQYSGARSRARDIPEVALWSSPAAPTLAELQEDLDYAIGQFDNRVAAVDGSAHTLLGRFATFVASEVYHYPDDHGSLRWPALNGETDQLIDDELYALRRPGYYTALYVGHPIHDPFYTDKFVPYISPAAPPSTGCPPLHVATYEDTGVPFPAWYSSLCGDDYPDFAVKHPFVGGGLSLVWTPDFGAALLAANWSPLVHHGVVGLGTNPTTSVLERTWERYSATVFHHADSSGAEISGSLPMYYEATDELDYARTYAFTDDTITVEVTLTNLTGAAQSFDALWENLPFPVCDQDCENNRKNRPVGFTEVDGTPLPAGDHLLDGIHLRDDQDHGLAVELDGGARLIAVRPIGMVREAYGIQLKIGRLQIPFDTTSLAAGESTSLRYHLRSLDSGGSVPPVTPVTDEPEIICGAPYDPSGGAGGTGGGGGTGPAAGGATDEDGGCGCRTGAPRRPALGWLALLLGLGAAALRRWRDR
ncbi:MAG: hypothetical protein JRI68_11420 [Deltaproteobacteria bacterium]|nr:hypothetical protein [Deltaproteobacteria bacterium]